MTRPSFWCDRGDLDALDDLGAALARALGQRHGDVGRIALAVERQVHRADHAVDVLRCGYISLTSAGEISRTSTSKARASDGLPVDLVLALLGQRDA